MTKKILIFIIASAMALSAYSQEFNKGVKELVNTGEVKSVNYNGIIGVLIEAVKELKKEIEELKSTK